MEDHQSSVEYILDQVFDTPPQLCKEKITAQPKGAWLGVAAKDFDLYHQNACEGDGNARFQLGLCYELGLGVDRDLTRAKDLYCAAIDNSSHNGARCQMGLCLQRPGKDRDIEEALRLYMVACENECARAAGLLAHCYFYADGVTEDDERALQLASSSAAANDPDGMKVLGQCYFHGGVSQDKDKALELWRRGAAQGHPGCLFRIACCYSRDTVFSFPERIAADDREELQLLRIAALQGDPDAAAMIAVFLLDGSGGLERNAEAAVALLQSAAAYGSVNAAGLLAVCYTDGVGVLQDLQEAGRWRSIATEHTWAIQANRTELQSLFTSADGDPMIANISPRPTDTTRTCRQLMRLSPQHTQVIEDHLATIIDDNLVCKVAVCGMSLSGKTTLIASLRRALYGDTTITTTPLSRRTAGVDISTLPLTLKEDGRDNVSTPVIVYDFAGHKEWHISHEYFVQFQGGVFLLLCDLSGSKDQERNNVDFWLRFLLTATSRMGPSHKKLQVLLVGSHADMAADPNMSTCICSTEPLAYVSDWGQQLASEMQQQYEGTLLEVSPEFYCMDCRVPGSNSVTAIRTRLQRYRLHVIADCFERLDKGSRLIPMNEYKNTIAVLEEKLHLPDLSVVRIAEFQSAANDSGYAWARNSIQLRQALRFIEMLGVAQVLGETGWLVTQPTWLAHDILQCVLGPEEWPSSTLRQVSMLGHVSREALEDRLAPLINGRCTMADAISLLSNMQLFFDDGSIIDKDAKDLMFHPIIKERRPLTSWELDASNFQEYRSILVQPVNPQHMILPSVIPRVQAKVLSQYPTTQVTLWCDAVLIMINDENTDNVIQALAEVDPDLRKVTVVVRQLFSTPPRTPAELENDLKTNNCFRAVLQYMSDIVESSMKENAPSLHVNVKSINPHHALPHTTTSFEELGRPMTVESLLSVRADGTWDRVGLGVYLSPSTAQGQQFDRWPIHPHSRQFLKSFVPQVTMIDKEANSSFPSLLQSMCNEFCNLHSNSHFLYPRWELKEFHLGGDQKLHQTCEARMWRHATLEHILQRYPPVACNFPGVRVQVVFIGTPNRAAAEKICAGGFPTKKTRTKGFFGHGVYCTLDLEYAYYFANNVAREWRGPDSAPCVIVALAAFGNPLPVIESPYGNPTPGVSAFSIGGEPLPFSPTFYGRAEQEGYDSHMVVVSKQQLVPVPVSQWNVDGVWTELVMMDRRSIAPLALLDFINHVDTLTWPK